MIYSQRGERADAVIERLACETGRSCEVVTSDRELRGIVIACGCTATYSGEFESRLNAVIS